MHRSQGATAQLGMDGFVVGAHLEDDGELLFWSRRRLTLWAVSFRHPGRGSQSFVQPSSPLEAG